MSFSLRQLLFIFILSLILGGCFGENDSTKLRDEYERTGGIPGVTGTEGTVRISGFVYSDETNIFHAPGDTNLRALRSTPSARVRLLGTSLSTLTDSIGHFELSGVPPGPCILLVERNDSYGSRFRSLHFLNVLNTPVNTLSSPIVLRKAGSVYGFVSLENSGTLSTANQGVTASLVGFPFAGESDSSGYFTIHFVPEGTYELLLAKAGYVAKTHEVQVLAGNSTCVEGGTLIRETQGTIPVILIGTVKDMDGNLIGGAVVEYVEGREIALSRSNGFYRLENLREGPISVRVSKEGYYLVGKQTSLVRGENRLDFVLSSEEKRQPGLVGGVVKDSLGNGIAGARILANPQNGVTVTDELGRYLLSLPEGAYVLSASRYGHATRTAEVAIVSGRTATLDFILFQSAGARLGKLRGRALDENGNPVTGASIRAFPGDYASTTGRDGFFIMYLPDGTFRVEGTRDGYVKGSTSVSIVGANDVACTLSMFTKDYAERPVISAVSPDRAYSNEAIRIVITGRNFKRGARVVLGTTELYRVEYGSSTYLTATVPPGIAPGTYDLKVINPDNLFGNSPNAFMILPPLTTVAYVTDWMNNSLVMVELESSRVKKTVSTSTGPTALAVNFSTGQAFVGTDISKALDIIDTNTGTKITSLSLDSAVMDMELLPNGGKLYVVTNNTLYVYNTVTGVLGVVGRPGTPVAGGKNLTHLAISPNGNYIYVTARDNFIYVYSVSTETLVASKEVKLHIQFEGPLTITVGPNSSWGACALISGVGSAGQPTYVVQKLDLTRSEPRLTGAIPGLYIQPSCSALSVDGRYLYFYSEGADARIETFDMLGDNKYASIPVPGGRAIVPMPEQEVVAIATNSQGIQIIHSRTGVVSKVAPPFSVLNDMVIGR